VSYPTDRQTDEQSENITTANVSGGTTL